MPKYTSSDTASTIVVIIGLAISAGELVRIGNYIYCGKTEACTDMVAMQHFSEDKIRYAKKPLRIFHPRITYQIPDKSGTHFIGAVQFHGDLIDDPYVYSVFTAVFFQKFAVSGTLPSE